MPPARYTIRRPEPQPEPEPSFLERMGGWRGVGATGIRGLSGLIAGVGGPWGAGAAGLGESLAEAAEGSPQNPRRIGVEAALGLVPFSKVFKAGRAATSALRGGVFGGAGAMGRQIAEDDDYIADPGSFSAAATSAGLGAVTGGLLAKLFGKSYAGRQLMDLGKKAEKVTPVGEEAIVEHTAVPGGRVLAGYKRKAAEGTTVPSPDPIIIHGSGKTISVESPRIPGLEPKAPIPLTGAPASASGRVEKILSREEKQKNALSDLFATAVAKKENQYKDTIAKLEDEFATRRDLKYQRLDAAEEKAEKARQASEAIQAIIAKRKLTPGTEAVSESLSAQTALGRIGARIPYKAPKAGEGEAGMGDLTDLLTGGPMQTGPLPTAGPAKAIYDYWLSMGRDPKEALRFAEKGIGKGPALKKAMAEGTPGVPEAPPTSSSRPYTGPPVGDDIVEGSAKYRYHDPITGEPKFQIRTASGPTDVGAEELTRRGIQVPEVPVRDDSAIRAARDAATARAAGPAPATAQESVTSPLANFFKPTARVDILGAANKAAKAAQAGGEEIPDEALRQLGIGLQTEAAAAGLPTRAKPAPDALQKFLSEKVSPKIGPTGTAKPPAPPAPPVPLGAAPEPPPTPPAVPVQEPVTDWVAEQNAYIDRIKNLPSNKGQIVPQALFHLFGGAAGAAIGGATDPLDDPLMSAIAGGVAGAAVPSAIAKIATAPGGVTQLTQKVWETLPNVVRANYLANPNILNNAISGPYGGGLFAALEAHLSGDPRGTQMLRLMAPGAWGREFMERGWPGAQDRLAGIQERAGGPLMAEARNLPEKIIAAPGTLLTAGDITTVNLAMQAGFSEAEARAMTLTAEPEFGVTRMLADFNKKGPFAQLLLPFGRTLANVAEEGSKRIPGLGEIVQSQRAIPDPAKTRFVQQVLGGAQMLGGTALGYYGGPFQGVANLLGAPESPFAERMDRGLASNVAGRGSLGASMGYAAGEAARRGRTTRQALRAGVTQGLQALPLPTVETPTDWWNYLTADPGRGVLPRSATPYGVPGAYQYLTGPDSPFFREGNEPQAPTQPLPQTPQRRYTIRRP